MKNYPIQDALIFNSGRGHYKWRIRFDNGDGTTEIFSELNFPTAMQAGEDLAEYLRLDWTENRPKPEPDYGNGDETDCREE